jgi:hypothetical protein
MEKLSFEDIRCEITVTNPFQGVSSICFRHVVLAKVERRGAATYFFPRIVKNLKIVEFQDGFNFTHPGLGPSCRNKNATKVAPTEFPMSLEEEIEKIQYLLDFSVQKIEFGKMLYSFGDGLPYVTQMQRFTFANGLVGVEKNVEAAVNEAVKAYNRYWGEFYAPPYTELESKIVADLTEKTFETFGNLNLQEIVLGVVDGSISRVQVPYWWSCDGCANADGFAFPDEGEKSIIINERVSAQSLCKVQLSNNRKIVAWKKSSGGFGAGKYDVYVLG